MRVTSWTTVNWSPARKPSFMLKTISIFLLLASTSLAQEPAELPSFRDVIERLDKSDESNFRAFDVIREELSKARSDREWLKKEIEALRGLSGPISNLSESLQGIPKSIGGLREELIGRISPLASLLERLSERIDSQAAEAEAARRGLLEAFAEARSELVRARAEAQKQYAEAELLRVKAQKELLDARGTLGSRLFWFSVSITGSIVVLLIGLAIIISVISRLASKITAVLSIVKPI